MKRTRITRLLMMGVVPIALSACEGEEPARLYASTQECASAGALTAAECQAGYEAARTENERVAPQYGNRADCIADFGQDACTRHSSGFFMPLMTGFLIGRALDGGNSYPQPLYRDRQGQFRTPGGIGVGQATGDVTVRKSAVKPQARAITMSRAGFGSRAAARGSWGGG
jgi:uncharacterized protein YgiB involved in biofilm formation